MSDPAAPDSERCPDCVERGSDAVRTRNGELACVNTDCRVRRFRGSKDDGLRAGGLDESQRLRDRSDEGLSRGGRDV